MTEASLPELEKTILGLLSGLSLRPPAARSSIQRIQSSLGIVLPLDYVTFLNISDGAEGPIGTTYLALWSTEEIPRLNEASGVKEFLPGLVIFGSDGGDTAYAFRKDGSDIVQAPFVGMAASEVQPACGSFIHFLRHLKEIGRF